MFALNSYLDKLYQVKWKFDDDMKEDLEDLLYVSFEKIDPYYKLESIRYTVVDLLLGLQTLNFNLTKNSNGIVIEIL